MSTTDTQASLDPGDGDRRSRLIGSLRQEGAKGVLIATVSTFVFFGFVIYVVTHSPYWPELRAQFFNWQEFRTSLPDIVVAFRRNIIWFLLAEPVMLFFYFLLAVMRSLRGPVFFPLRVLATIYVDFFRGIPTLLIVYLLGFGMPTLAIPGLPTAGAFWGVFALVLSYSAYVAEVYRAGIASVHASQTAAARALGLTRWQTLRSVVVPQAVRRVVPALMNDFLALQKDTALVSVVAGTMPEAFLMSQIFQTGTFNFTHIFGAALCFLTITIPLTRFTDWLLERQRRRRMAGGAT